MCTPRVLIKRFDFQMKDYTDIDEFDRAVDSIPLMGFTTRIDKALRLAQKDLYALKYGARPSTPKILIVLTDGSQSWEFDFEDPGEVVCFGVFIRTSKFWPRRGVL